VLGVLFVLCVVAHSVLNLWWFKRIFKGKYSPRRTLGLVVNLLIMICVLGLLVSGAMMSVFVFRFLNIESGMHFARVTHLLCGYWGFVLLSFHLGLHWKFILRGHFSKTGKLWMRLGAFALAALGVYFLVQNQIFSYLFFQNTFVFIDAAKPLWLALFENVCMMAPFVGAGHLVQK
jgi:hypothetical protein